MPIIPELNPNIPGRLAAVAPSLGAAMAAGNAMRQVGNDISGAGEQIGNIGLQFQAARDQGVKNSARLAMQHADAVHQEFRLKNLDETTWEANRAEGIAKARESVMGQKMSPFMKEELDVTFQGWQQAGDSDTRLDAIKYRMAKDRTVQTQLMEGYRRNGDAASMRALNAEGRGKLYSVEEADANDKDIDDFEKENADKQAFEAKKQEIAANPSKAWAETYTKADPPEGVNAVEWQQLKAHARSLHNQKQIDIVEAVRDGVASGAIINLDHILGNQDPDPKKKIHGVAEDASPRVQAVLKNEFLANANEKTQELRKMPGYQARVIGQVAASMRDLDPKDIDSRVELENLIGRLNPGPTKNQLSGELADKISGKPPQTTALTLGERSLSDAYKGRFFHAGSPPVPMRVDEAIHNGFLKSVEKLQIVGFDAAQAQAIRDATTNKEREKLFRDTWMDRKGKDTSTGFIKAAAQAVADGKPEIIYESPEIKKAKEVGESDASARYGRTLDQLHQWAAAHPEDAKDDTKVRNQINRLAAPGNRDAFIDAAFQGHGTDEEQAPGFGLLPPPGDSADGLEILLPPLNQ